MQADATPTMVNLARALLLLAVVTFSAPSLAQNRGLPRSPRSYSWHAQKVLGRPLRPAEVRAVNRAHLVGENQLGADGIRAASIGNYRPAHIREKYRILRAAGLPAAQARALIEQGVVGHHWAALPDRGASDAANREIAHDLFHGRAVSARPFSANQNNTTVLLVTVRNDGNGRSRDALFKPRGWGDNDGWNRTPMEYVFYEVNRQLGMDWVPPAAYRRHFDANFQHHDEGALLYLVPDVSNLVDHRSHTWGVRPDLFLSDARVLDVLLQNPDRHPRNFLMGRHWADGRRRPILIDHAASLRPRTSTSMDGNDAFGSGAIQVVRKSTLDALRALDFNRLRERIGEFVSDGEIRGILGRRDGIVRYFENLAAQRGGERVVIDTRD